MQEENGHENGAADKQDDDRLKSQLAAENDDGQQK